LRVSGILTPLFPEIVEPTRPGGPGRALVDPRQLPRPEFVTQGPSLVLSGARGTISPCIAYRAIQNGFEALFTTATTTSPNPIVIGWCYGLKSPGYCMQSFA
jgi:hypothetical protein